MFSLPCVCDKRIRIFTFYWPSLTLPSFCFCILHIGDIQARVIDGLSFPVAQWSECASAQDRTSFTKSCFAI